MSELLERIFWCAAMATWLMLFGALLAPSIRRCLTRLIDKESTRYRD